MSAEFVAWLGWTAFLVCLALWLLQRGELIRERYMREFWERNFTRLQNGQIPQPQPEP